MGRRQAADDAFAYVEIEDILLQTVSHIKPGDNIKTADLVEAEAVLQTFFGSFVGGSVLVNSNSASDIDIIVPMFQARSIVHGRLDELGYEYTFDAAYSDTALELDSSWRKGKVNVIIINPLFYTAYALGAHRLRADGLKYSALRQYEDRDTRVQMHTEMKNVIRDWIKA